jgi:hypothetical protein
MLKKKTMMRKMMKLKEEDVEDDADEPRMIDNNSNRMTEMLIKRVEVLLHDE